MDEEQVAALVQALKGGDWDAGVVTEAAEALVRLGPPAVTALTDALRSRHPEVRVRAAWALGEIHDPRAILALLDALGDANGPVRRAALAALGRVVGTGSVPAFAAALADEDRDLRQGAAETLVEAGAVAIPALVGALAGQDGRARFLAAWALGEIAGVYPILALRSALPALRSLRGGHPVFRETLARIEVATAGLRDLPLTAAAPSPSVESLPVISAAPGPTPGGLPLPASAPAEDSSVDTPETDPALTGWRQNL